ncbi:MAG: cobalamin-binding protein [Kurthia sp.]|nr:cobalamin-binding protein [Candidatus Kurthia equi]
MKLISICPSNTELVELLGLTDQLIAVDDFSDWPAQVKDLPQLGSDLSVDIDMIEKLQPDLVLASLSVPGMEKNVASLQQRNIPHIVLNANSLEEIIEELELIGRACHCEEKAAQVATSYRAKISELRAIAATIDTPPTLYWEWWPNPIFTPGGVNWLTEISELAGASNLFKDVELASVMTDFDDVCLRNPDYILLAWVGVAYERINTKVIEKRPGWTALNAWKNQHVYKMEEWLYCRPSPRLLQGAIQLAQRLHPHAYQEVSLPDFLVQTT